MKKIERLLALILVFAMALTIFPAAAFVEEVSAEIPEAPTGDADLSVSLTVVNTPGFDLPQTGDYGTWMFSVIGIALMAVSGLALFGASKNKKIRR